MPNVGWVEQRATQKIKMMGFAYALSKSLHSAHPTFCVPSPAEEQGKVINP